jgi:hypothetical protein
MLSAILHILERVQAKISDDSDVAWTRYDTPAALRAELTLYVEQLKAGNMACLEKLRIHFLPTGTFQEHGISNGWGDEYLRLAAIFDKAYASLTGS